MEYNFNFRINIDDRILNFFKRLMIRRNLLIMLALVITSSTIFVFAAQITKQYAFTSGTTISSSKMNANFDDLFAQVNTLDTQVTTLNTQVTGLDKSIGSLEDIYFPDGFSSSTLASIIQNVSSMTTLSVASNKNLYIYSVTNSTSSPESLVYGGQRYFTITGSTIFFPPLVFKGGSTLSTYSTSSLFFIKGIIADSNTTVTVLNKSVTAISSYTVPSGKKLFVHSLHGRGATGGSFNVNSLNILQLLQNEDKIFSAFPLIFPEGTVISTNDSIIMTGVEK